MILAGKQRLRARRKIQKINSNWNLYGFFLLISFPFALISTIIFYLTKTKTIFWSERGTASYPWFRGYITVFFFLWFYIASALIIFYILLLLFKSLFQSKKRHQQKKSGKYLLIFLSNQLAYNLFLIWLWKGRTKNTIIMIMLISFLLIVLNSFFIHYFFSKPVEKLLLEKYPYYFPKYFHQKTKQIMKVDGMKFKKSQTTTWAIMITFSLINFWLISMLLLLKR